MISSGNLCYICPDKHGRFSIYRKLIASNGRVLNIDYKNKKKFFVLVLFRDTVLISDRIFYQCLAGDGNVIVVPTENLLLIQ
jgi:hypothetical protein